MDGLQTIHSWRLALLTIAYFLLLQSFSPATASSQLALTSTPARQSPQEFTVPHNPPIYSEVIPTSFVPSGSSPNDWKEQFLAPNGKAVTVLVQAPRGSGTYSRAMESTETPDTYFPAVVSEALAAGAYHLVIPKGVYNFHGPTMTPTGSCNVNAYWNCAAHWTIYGQQTPTELHDLWIDGSGSTLNFKAPSIGILLYNVLRIRLSNFIVDWPSVPMSALGTVVADPTNPGHNAVAIDDLFPVSAYPKDFTANGSYPAIQAINLWKGADATGHFDPSVGNNLASDEVYFIFLNNPDLLPTYIGNTSAGNQTYSCKNCGFVNSTNPADCSFYNGCANFDYFPIGSRVVVRYLTYNGQAISTVLSDDVAVDGITLYTSPGMGITDGSNGSHRGFRLANSTITRASGRPVSTVADAINTGDMAGDVIITGNEVAYQGDDSIAVSSAARSFTAVGGLSPSGGTITSNPSSTCDSNPGDYVLVGDWVAFFDQNQKYLSSAIVSSVTLVCSPTAQTAQFTFGLCTSGNCSTSLGGLTSSGSFTNLSEQATARFVISQNKSHDCRCDGVLTSSPYGEISGNHFYNTSGPGVTFVAGSGDGIGPSNVVVSNNSISTPGTETVINGAIFLLDTSAGAAPDPIFEKIVISRNTIDNVPGPAVVATSAAEVYIRDNTIKNANTDTQNPGSWGSLSTLDSIVMDAVSYGNVCGPQPSGSSGPIGIDPSDTHVTSTPLCPQAVFTASQSDQSFTVPAGVTKVHIQMWGAGGGGAQGGGNGGCNTTGYPGGAGGYSTGTLAVSSGEVLTIVVGEGGAAGNSSCATNAVSSGGFGGGGNGTGGDAGGGGRSAVLIGTEEVMTAGGGGGGGASNFSVRPGGAGGGLSGLGLPAPGGAGGTQASGGAGGSGNFCKGDPGTARKGGLGGGVSNCGFGAGGGGGYFGGGGGGANGQDDGGGGGGSSFVAGTGVSGASTLTGRGANPPNTADPNHEPGVGTGGEAGRNGGNGLIVIRY